MPGLQRRADADGGAERDFVAAELPQLLRDIHHRLRLHLAVIGATEHAGDIAAHLDAVGPGARYDRLEEFNEFGDQAIAIGARNTFPPRRQHPDLQSATAPRDLTNPFSRATA